MINDYFFIITFHLHPQNFYEVNYYSFELSSFYFAKFCFLNNHKLYDCVFCLHSWLFALMLHVIKWICVFLWTFSHVFARCNLHKPSQLFNAFATFLVFSFSMHLWFIITTSKQQASTFTNHLVLWFYVYAYYFHIFGCNYVFCLVIIWVRC